MQLPQALSILTGVIEMMKTERGCDLFTAHDITRSVTVLSFLCGQLYCVSWLVLGLLVSELLLVLTDDRILSSVSGCQHSFTPSAHHMLEAIKLITKKLGNKCKQTGKGF